MQRCLALLLVVVCMPNMYAAGDLIYRLNQTQQQHQETADTLNGRGYVPIYVGASVQNGKLTLDQVWESVNDRPGWEMRAALTDSQYANKDREKNQQGFNLYSHCRYKRDGQVYHAAIWQRGYKFPNMVSYAGKTQGEHQRATEEYAKKGMTPIYIKPTAYGNSVYLDAIWRMPARPYKWELRSSLDDNAYTLKDCDLNELGYRRSWHYEYTVQSTRRHATIWEKH